MHKYNQKQLKENFQDLEEYFNKDIALIVDDYNNLKAGKELRQLEEIEKNQDPTLVREYNQKTRCYPYELSLQEAGVNYQKLYGIVLKFIKKFKANSLLDYGAGIGGLPIFLNNKIQADHLDIPSFTYGFAKFRFKKRNLKINLLTPDSFGDHLDCYDLITSFECFEHIHDLEDAFSRISQMLKKNGHLISISTFRGGGDHLARNDKYNNIKEFNKLATKFGFRFKGYFPRTMGVFLPAKLAVIMSSLKQTSGRLIICQKI